MKRIVKILSFIIVTVLLLSLIKLPAFAKNYSITVVEAPNAVRIDDIDQGITIEFDGEFCEFDLLYFSEEENDWVDSYCIGEETGDNTMCFILCNYSNLHGATKYVVEGTTAYDDKYRSSEFTITWIGYDIKFDCSASGTDGKMDDATDIYMYYEMPYCTVKSADDKIFVWWTDADDIPYFVNEEVYISEDKTFYAQYKKVTGIDVSYYGGDVQVGDKLRMDYLYIFLDLDNGDDWLSLNFEECLITLNKKQVDLDTFVFDKKGTYEFEISKYDVRTTLLIEVFQSVTKYKISYDKGLGTGEMDVDYVNQNGCYSLQEPTFSAPDDCDFDYWLYDEVRYYLGTEVWPTSDMTFTAIYRENDSQIKTVTLLPGKGSGKPKYYDMLPGKFTLPECPFAAPEGYQFCGWEIGSDLYQPGAKVEIEYSQDYTAKYEHTKKIKSMSAKYDSVVEVGKKLSWDYIIITLVFEDNSTEVIYGYEDDVVYYLGEEEIYTTSYKWMELGKQKVTIKYEDQECEMEFRVVTAEEANQYEANKEKKNLPAWAVVLIIAGSALLVLVGAFAVYWFVIEKKSFADLKHPFKK